jgi:membrane-bound serine protease (ClpP class)
MIRVRPGNIRFMALVLLAGLLFAPTGGAAAQGISEVIVLSVDTAIVPATDSYIQRGIREAEERGAEAVLLMLDTPGGSVGATLNIVQTMRTSEMPVIVFVGPRGATAASAGLLVTLAGHVAVMAPETAIGASSPVGLQGEDLEATIDQKTRELLSAEARGLAERRGEDAVALAEAAVNEARAVNSTEALEAGLIDFIADDIGEALEQVDGFEIEVGGRERTLDTAHVMTTFLEMSPLEELLTIITDPNLIFLLISIGTIAIIIEIQSPGGWLAGVVGVTCVGLGMYGAGVLPVNWLGIVFIIMAFVLFVLDIKAPTHGALTAGAIACLITGAVLLLNQPAIRPFGQLSIPLVVAVALMIGAFFFFVIGKALQAQTRTPTTGREGLVGKTGRVTEAIDPVGKVVVWGERWQAVSADEAPIPAQARVEVVKVDEMTLHVRLADRAAANEE